MSVGPDPKSWVRQNLSLPHDLQSGVSTDIAGMLGRMAGKLNLPVMEFILREAQTDRAEHSCIKLMKNCHNMANNL